MTEYGVLSLKKTDIQLFMKKLRKKEHGKLRYYTVGEYGTKTYRPHYHTIIFNGSRHINKNIQDSWSDRENVPRGITHCGNVNNASIHYITKYHVNYTSKKDWEAFQEFGEMACEREFATMSRNPGIGFQYIKRAGKWNRENNNLYVMNNGFKQAMPRYYKNKMFTKLKKEIMAAIAIKKADTAYIKEVKRLLKLKYENPTFEIDDRNYKKSLAIIKNAKNESKI